MDRKHIPKIEYGSFPPGAGWGLADHYDPITHQKSGYEPQWLCPVCRHWYRLTLHSIEKNGEVNASVLCPGKRWNGPEKDELLPCNYHEFVIFDDWDPRYYKVAGHETIIDTLLQDMAG